MVENFQAEPLGGRLRLPGANSCIAVQIPWKGYSLRTLAEEVMRSSLSLKSGLCSPGLFLPGLIPPPVLWIPFLLTLAGNWFNSFSSCVFTLYWFLRCEVCSNLSHLRKLFCEFRCPIISFSSRHNFSLFFSLLPFHFLPLQHKYSLNSYMCQAQLGVYILYLNK